MPIPEGDSVRRSLLLLWLVLVVLGAPLLGGPNLSLSKPIGLARDRAGEFVVLENDRSRAGRRTATLSPFSDSYVMVAWFSSSPA
jgi:hypothetical protein